MIFQHKFQKVAPAERFFGGWWRSQCESFSRLGTRSSRLSESTVVWIHGLNRQRASSNYPSRVDDGNTFAHTYVQGCVGDRASGFLLPDFVLTWLVRRRQQRLRRALPDALDFLVVCLEAGLGPDQALLKVAQELRITHPALSEEFQLVNQEMRVGKTRIEALHELGRRTGLDDVTVEDWDRAKFSEKAFLRYRICETYGS